MRRRDQTIHSESPNVPVQDHCWSFAFSLLPENKEPGSTRDEGHAAA
jgi:hypothetical protein